MARVKTIQYVINGSELKRNLIMLLLLNPGISGMIGVPERGESFFDGLYGRHSMMPAPWAPTGDQGWLAIVAPDAACIERTLHAAWKGHVTFPSVLRRRI